MEGQLAIVFILAQLTVKVVEIVQIMIFMKIIKWLNCSNPNPSPFTIPHPLPPLPPRTEYMQYCNCVKTLGWYMCTSQVRRGANHIKNWNISEDGLITQNCFPTTPPLTCRDVRSMDWLLKNAIFLNQKLRAEAMAAILELSIFWSTVLYSYLLNNFCKNYYRLFKFYLGIGIYVKFTFIMKKITF